MPWQGLQGIAPKKFPCGYCGSLVASGQGYWNNQPARGIYICPHCGEATTFGDTGQLPGVSPGNDVSHLPDDIAALYSEARRCVAANANTASVLICRKLLMNIAVAQGAKAGESFVSYVEYLANAGFVPPNGRGWVDHIRSKGNEANHEIKLMSQTEAEELISFSEMLLKFIYEFPNRVPPKSP